MTFLNTFTFPNIFNYCMPLTTEQPFMPSSSLDSNPFESFNIWSEANNNNSYLFNNQFNAFNNFTMPNFCDTFNNTNIFSKNSFCNFNFEIPTFNTPSFSFSKTTSSFSTSSVKSTSVKPYKIGNFDLEYWKAKGYDHDKGKALALDAAKVEKGEPGQCVGYTRKTINRVYGTKFTNAGAAYKFGTTILSAPELKGKFIKVDMKDVEKAGIPDGAIVLWNPGSPGFTKGKSATYGHGGICYQNKVYSNYVESRHLSTCAEIWIPVKSA